MMRAVVWIPLVLLTLFVCGVLAALLLHVSPAEIWQALSSRAEAISAPTRSFKLDTFANKGAASEIGFEH